MKKIIALIGALSMTVAMAVSASAAVTPTEKGLSVMYDAAASTNGVANFKVYCKGFDGIDLQQVNIVLQLDKTIFNCNAEEVTEYSSDMGTRALATSGRLTTSYINADKITFSRTDGLIAEYNIPLLGTMTSKIVNTTASIKTAKVQAKLDGETSTEINFLTNSNVPTGYAVKFNDIAVQSATATGTTVSEDAASDAATYFKVENAPLAGTAYWYADFAGTAKKLAANVPNTVGTADLGFVYTGADAPTSVKIVCE